LRVFSRADLLGKVTVTPAKISMSLAKHFSPTTE
jgi:hypothetical protein